MRFITPHRSRYAQSADNNRRFRFMAAYEKRIKRRQRGYTLAHSDVCKKSRAPRIEYEVESLLLIDPRRENFRFGHGETCLRPVYCPACST